MKWEEVAARGRSYCKRLVGSAPVKRLRHNQLLTYALCAPQSCSYSPFLDSQIENRSHLDKFCLVMVRDQQKDLDSGKFQSFRQCSVWCEVQDVFMIFFFTLQERPRNSMPKPNQYIIIRYWFSFNSSWNEKKKRHLLSDCRMQTYLVVFVRRCICGKGHFYRWWRLVAPCARTSTSHHASIPSENICMYLCGTCSFTSARVLRHQGSRYAAGTKTWN